MNFFYKKNSYYIVTAIFLFCLDFNVTYVWVLLQNVTIFSVGYFMAIIVVLGYIKIPVIYVHQQFRSGHLLFLLQKRRFRTVYGVV